MHILILHMRYAPDATGTGPLVTQLAEDLANSGDQVTVITSVPHYGQSEISEKYQQGLLSRSEEKGVAVWRTAAFPQWGGTVLGRSIDYALYTLLALWASFRVRKPEVILAIAPPITVGPLAWIVSGLKRAPMVYNAQDIWPDGLIRMGRLRNPVLIRLFGWLESWIYRVADRVIVVSAGMRQNLLEKDVPKSKIQVIANWVDLDQISPVARDNAFSRQHGLTEQFVVLFAGNLGYAAGLEVMVEAAGRCRQEQDLVFLLVGEGSAKPGLQRQVQERGLDNVHFLPTQPVERLSQMLGSADLSLVTLRPGMGGLSVPSKTYAYMASARPILAAVPVDSAIRLLIDEAGCGRSVPAGDSKVLAEAILAMRSREKELRAMGKRGRTYAEAHCGRGVAVGRYRQLLAGLAAREV